MSDAMFAQRGAFVDDKGALTRRGFGFQYELYRRTGEESGITGVPYGGTGLSSGTPGGILGFTAATTIASSVLLTLGAPVVGGGVSATPYPLPISAVATRYLANTGPLNAAAWDTVSLTTGASGTLQAAQFPALLGDVTTSAGSLTTAIGVNKVTLGMMAQIADARILGNSSGITANVSALATLPTGVQDNITRLGTIVSGAVPTTLLTGLVTTTQGGTGQNWSASSGIPLLTTGSASLLSSTGTGNVARADSPTFTTLITTPAINGGTAANDDITIQGTTNATRTTSYVILQPNGGNAGVGTTTPGSGYATTWDAAFDVVSSGISGIVTRSSGASGAAFFTQRNNNAKELEFGTYGSGAGAAWFGVAHANNSFVFTYPDGLLTVGTYGNANLALGTNNLTRVTILGSNGNSGFGVVAPTAVNHIKAGIAGAAGGPLKFTSGPLLTAKEAGAWGFLTDDLYFTQTTGPTEKAIAWIPSQTDVTATRALDTTYTAPATRSIMVMATVRCAVTLAGGNAYVQGKSDTATPPTTIASGLVGIQAGLLGEDNSFQIQFTVAPGKTYIIVSAATNGTVTKGSWFEVAF